MTLAKSRNENGIYATYKGIPNNVFDLYIINVNDEHDDTQSQTNTNTKYGNIKRYTIGARGKGKIASTNFGYGYKITYQLGRMDSVTTGTEKSLDIWAYAAYADVSYTFKGVFCQSMIKFEYNYACGDDDPNDGVSKTLDPLYQSTYDPYGLIDFFRW